MNSLIKVYKLFLLVLTQVSVWYLLVLHVIVLVSTFSRSRLTTFDNEMLLDISGKVIMISRSALTGAQPLGWHRKKTVPFSGHIENLEKQATILEDQFDPRNPLIRAISTDDEVIRKTLDRELMVTGRYGRLSSKSVRQLISEISQGEHQRLFFVSEASSGKTSILDAIHKQLEAEGVTVYTVAGMATDALSNVREAAYRNQRIVIIWLETNSGLDLLTFEELFPDWARNNDNVCIIGENATAATYDKKTRQSWKQMSLFDKDLQDKLKNAFGGNIAIIRTFPPDAKVKIISDKLAKEGFFSSLEEPDHPVAIYDNSMLRDAVLRKMEENPRVGDIRIILQHMILAIMESRKSKGIPANADNNFPESISDQLVLDAFNNATQSKAYDIDVKRTGK